MLFAISNGTDNHKLMSEPTPDVPESPQQPHALGHGVEQPYPAQAQQPYAHQQPYGAVPPQWGAAPPTAVTPPNTSGTTLAYSLIGGLIGGFLGVLACGALVAIAVSEAGGSWDYINEDRVVMMMVFFGVGGAFACGLLGLVIGSSKAAAERRQFQARYSLQPVWPTAGGYGPTGLYPGGYGPTGQYPGGAQHPPTAAGPEER